ncbi:LIM/homeobox protein Lhx2 [Schistosoma japonicum]|nr:LIM/homeobox protein Lhx2 [Schistosoma japonicum]
MVFHSECFCCNICRRILKCGDRYELDNINNHPVCWDHRKQRCDHHLNSVLGYMRQHETINCSTENNQRDIEKTKEMSNQIYSAHENTCLKLFNDSGVLFDRDTNHDAEDLPAESFLSINNVEPCNRLHLIDYGDQKQKSSVKSYGDKQLYKDEKCDRIRSYFIPMIGKLNPSIELLSNDLSHRPIHYLPPPTHQLSQTNSSDSSCNLMDKSLCKVESCSFNERLQSSRETLCSPYQSSTASASPYSLSLFPSCTPIKTVSSYPSSTSCISFTSASIPNFANTSVTLLSIPSLSSSSSPTPLSSGNKFIHKHLNISPLNYSPLLSGNDSSSLIDLMDSNNPLQANTPIDSNILLQHTQQKRNRKRRSGIHHVFDDNCINSGTNFYLGITTRQKRMRTSFKHHQLRTMKAYFSINHNPDVKDLKVLTEKTGLSKRVLQVWFQNARAKYRRNLVRQESTPTSVSNSNNNNNLSSSLITSSNGGLSEIMGNSISECDSQSSQINPDDFTMSQTTLSSTSLHKNNMVQDFGDDIEDEEEDGLDEVNDTDDKIGLNKVIGVLNKYEHQTKHNIQEIQCDSSNLIKFEDNPNCSYYQSHRLTNELHKLTSHNENDRLTQQQQQSSINFSSFTTPINASILHPSYVDNNMLISQDNNKNDNLLHTNKIHDNQLTTNVINYATKQNNNFILSNKCRTVNGFTLTGIHS